MNVFIALIGSHFRFLFETFLLNHHVFFSITFSLLKFLFVMGFYSPVNNKVMSSRSVNSGTVPGQTWTF